jgi:hypothetical protein
MSAYDETVKFLKDKHSYLFTGIYKKVINKILLNDNYNFLYCLYYIRIRNNNNKLILEDILNHFLNIKNIKLLDSFKKYLNVSELLYEIYKDKLLNNIHVIENNIITNLIFLGGNINSDFLLIDKPPYETEEVLKIYNNLKKIENSKVCNDVCKDYFNIFYNNIYWKKEKLECYNLIKKAYYAQKINRFIKYYYDDKYRLSKFRYNLEKNKYLRILKNIPGSS